MDSDPAPPRWPAYLGWMPRFLFETDKIPERYIGKAWLVDLLPSLVLAALVSWVVPEEARHKAQYDSLLRVVLTVVVGPFVETLLMIPPLVILNRLFGPGIAVLGSTLLWATAHSLSAPAWGLVVWWGFLILSIAFLTWRRNGLGPAILVVFAIHALGNALVVLTVLMAG